MDLSYPYICATKSDIPAEALPNLDDEIVSRIGDSFTELFPQFGKSFVGASSAIEAEWSTPLLVLKKGMREWVGHIVVQRKNKNLFFSLQPEFADKDGELFDEDYAMLPVSWKELYRWFDSFHVTDEAYAQMNWWNTPFRFSARLDLDDYEEGSGASRKKTDAFAKEVGCKREYLRCFLLTENEDALFINEMAGDGRVFHVKGKNMDEITELNDPRKSLDDYLSFFLSGGKPSNYNFVQ